ncbi:MAG TPA: hypothetical protein VMM60_17230 [Ilumatobacter sp.]|nr:hypothetical protein [Ilumatobacter sp.]
MPFVQSRGDDEEASTDVAAGAPPSRGDEIEWTDPDLVKVHYDLAGWTFEQRAELAETLAEGEIPHRWEGDELVVPEAIEAEVDAMFEVLEAELGPFPVLLDAEEAGTEFGLEEWPATDLEVLQQALIEAEIPHRWEGRTLLVATDAESTVDDLLDAIEAGETASLDEGVEAPEGALHDLYEVGDRLARDATNASARELLFALAPELLPQRPPYGIAGNAWSVIVARAAALVEVFETGGPAEDISAAAAELRSVSRPYV